MTKESSYSICKIL